MNIIAQISENEQKEIKSTRRSIDYSAILPVMIAKTPSL